MARTTRKPRPTKHRGNAAGMIESRGRTGRKPNASEKRSSSSSGGRGSSSGTRRSRSDKPPTWKGSLIRAGVAALVVYVVSTLLLGKSGSAVRNLALIPIVLALYMPIIYYSDMFMYRRAQSKKSAR